MLAIKKYISSLYEDWNRLIEESLNGTFLLKRTYMDYHRDVFNDNSYFIYKGQSVIAVFPAAFHLNEPKTLTSHAGLTYGGLISARNLKYPFLEDIYFLILSAIRDEGFHKLVVKPVPRSVASFYTETEYFFLHKQGFNLIKQDIGSFLDLRHPVKLNSSRKENIKKAKNNNIHISIKEDNASYREFWEILTSNLQDTHNVKPVHSLDEILHLKFYNPDNLKLYAAEAYGKMVSGVLIYQDLNKNFVHTQYISSNSEGKEVGATDSIIFKIIEDYKNQVEKLSFGISSVNGDINYGLLGQKEGFGTLTDIYRTYEKDIRV